MQGPPFRGQVAEATRGFAVDGIAFDVVNASRHDPIELRVETHREGGIR